MYVSASHNPVGHNGIKFGLSRDGGVLNAQQAAQLIAIYKKMIYAPNRIQLANQMLSAPVKEGIKLSELENKQESLIAYEQFTKEVLSLLFVYYH